MRATYHYPRALVLLQPTLTNGQTIDIITVPVDVDWVRNDITEADEATVTVDWADLPLDPRAIGDCRVTVYAADVGDPDKVISIRDRRYVRFVGYVDEPSIDFSDDGQRVTLRCRDYTGLLLDAKWQGKGVRVDRPLSQTLRELIEAHPGYRGASIVVARDDRVYGRDSWVPAHGSSIWDVCVAISKATGQTPRWVLGELVVSTPEEALIEDTRILVYGDQVARMDLRRHMNPTAGRTIQVSALDTESGRVIAGQYPAGTAENIQGFTRPAGAWSKAVLDAQARHIYETWQRRQVTGTLETRAMSDLDGSDLVGLESGHLLYVRARSADRASVLGMSRSELASYLHDRGMVRTVANALASSWANSEDLATLFYVVRAAHRWSRDDGYSLRVEFGSVLSA